jgi:hypothetical protein
MKMHISQLPGVNSDLWFSEDGSPVDIFLFFNIEVVRLVQRETSIHIEQQINK